MYLLPRIFFVAAAMCFAIPSIGLAKDRACVTASVTGANAWFPVSYKQDGAAAGLGFDVARAALTRTGTLVVATRADLAFGTSMQRVADGEIDVVAGVYFTEERARAYHYTSAFMEDEIRVFTRMDSQFPFESLDDLKGLRGNRPMSGSYGDAFDTFAKQHLMMSEVFGENLLVHQLVSGRVDYTVLALFDGMRQRKERGLEDVIVPLATPVASNPVHLIVSRRSPCAEKVDAMNAVIADMRRSGELDSMVDRYLN